MQKTFGHVGVEFESIELVILHFTVEPHSVLVDWQQPVFVCTYAHHIRRMCVQGSVKVGSMAQQSSMNDQGTAVHCAHTFGLHDIAVEITGQQRGRGHLHKHLICTFHQHPVRRIGHPQSEVIVCHVVDAVMRQHPVTCGQGDAGFPFRRADAIALIFQPIVRSFLYSLVRTISRVALKFGAPSHFVAIDQIPR